MAIQSPDYSSFRFLAVLGSILLFKKWMNAPKYDSEFFQQSSFFIFVIAAFIFD